MKKGRCIDCIFFAKESRSAGKFSISTKIRNNPDKLKTVSENFSLFCYKGCWDCGVNPKLEKDIREIIEKERDKNECYFFEYVEGMLFQAADDLLRNNRNDLESNKTRKIAWCGILISLASLVLSFISIFIKK